MITKKKTKKVLPISIDRKLDDILTEHITNKSRYIEYLILQDLTKSNIEGIKDIFI